MPAARFDDLRAGRAQLCPPPLAVLSAERTGEVVAVLDEVDRRTEAGWWAYGFIAYEAAPALDPTLVTRAPQPGLPLVWFAICREPVAVPLLGADGGPRLDWRPDWTPDQHAGRVAKIRAEIARGNTYQVNLTTRLRAEVSDVERLYGNLAHSQRGSYNALIDTGRWVVASASPELFLRRRGDVVTMRPMKGTARRGRDLAEDAAVARALRASDKERAENVMIVDMVRNDLAQVATDVRATAIGSLEQYETVWQLTSDVEARLPAGTGLVDLLRAVFPCASVTGAPKPATMRLIAELEDAPRGVYAGAVGLLGPRSARLAVPIRTVTVDRETSRGVFGTGGGITWSSEAAAEYAELRAKTDVLGRYAERRLLETMRYVAGVGIAERAAHLHRLADSARYLGFECDADLLRERLDALTAGADQRLRLLLARDGSVELDLQPLGEVPTVVRLAVDAEPVCSADRWLRHKTTARDPYDMRLARHLDADDVVLVNELGHVTETARANIALRRGARWLTPPLADGLLAGIARRRLLADGRIVEATVTLQQLQAAAEIRVFSALRGVRPAVLG